jgi:hypothetical protein
MRIFFSRNFGTFQRKENQMNKAEESKKKEAKIWIANHSPHKMDCYEYTRKYMHDLTIVNKITNWIEFQCIVTDMGYDVYVDICENEWWEHPRTIIKQNFS